MTADITRESQTRFPDWRSYSAEELSRQYNQATLVPDNASYRARKTEAADHAHLSLNCMHDVAYGPSRAERMDIFPAGTRPLSSGQAGAISSGQAGAMSSGQAGAPIHLFLHGGAWKSGGKRSSAYAAKGFVEAGVVYIAVDFALVPDVLLEEQVRQCRAAVAWAWRHADRFGGDRGRLFVSGHSSGGHLAGMVAVTDWAGMFDLPADTVRGVACFSGMFDLEPVRHSWRNSYLGLDEQRARALSPIARIPENPPALTLGFGDGELTEFQRQSTAFAAAWRAKGHACAFECFSGMNHFDVGGALGDPRSPVAGAVFRLMGLQGPADSAVS